MNASHQQQLCTEFMRVLGNMKSELSAYADSRGLTMQQTYVLQTLHEHGAMLMGAVAERMHCDASNITGIIDRLVTQGFVERRELPEDRRAKQLLLTKNGQAIVADIMQELPGFLGLQKLSGKSCSELYHCLRQL